ncbi:alkaline phosphatase D family protein [Roseateles sp.]|uniref:alkaline phosphatase D family protein n=1 Tax=Roseateles sp. TaxID=1971397 RepID=UPI0031D87878
MTTNQNLPPHDDGETGIDRRRRQLLGGAAAAGLLAAVPLDAAVAQEPLNVRFTHGVASGDPLGDRVILWTRVLPQHAGDAGEGGRRWRSLPDVPVQWEIAEDESFSQVVGQGSWVATRSNDFCVKVDAQGLQPGTNYWYRFKAGSATSATGRTRTLPAGKVARVCMAVFSCANYAAGHFHVYAEAVKRMEADPGRYDALLHLGDYIYESAADGYASEDAKALGRQVDPVNETLKLRDYRRRYAQCRADAALQRLHQLAPMIAVWDDHEFANNTWREGAENHQEAEGAFKRRKNAAARAWREWLPVRDMDRRLVNHRGFDFGDLLSLNMLETRIQSRQKQLELKKFMPEEDFDQAAFLKAIHDPERDLLGPAQTKWLSDRMRTSSATWTVLGQQVLMGRMLVPAAIMMDRERPGSGLSPEAFVKSATRAKLAPHTLTPREKMLLSLRPVPYNLDAWDGYPTSRDELLELASSLKKNLVVLAGDTHNAWANDLLDGERHVGVEFATPSVTSPGLEVTLAPLRPDDVATLFKTFIPSLKFAETRRRGYMEVTATHEVCRADWVLIDTVKAPVYAVGLPSSMQVLPGEGHRRLVAVQSVG